MKLYKTVATEQLDSIQEHGLLTQNKLHMRGLEGNPHVHYPLTVPALAFRFNYHFFRSDIPKLGDETSLLSYETDLSDVLVANIRLTNSSMCLKRHYMDSVMPAQEFMARSGGTVDWSSLDPITGYTKTRLKELQQELECDNFNYANRWFAQLDLDSMYDEYFPEFLVPGSKIDWSQLTLEKNLEPTSIEKIMPSIRKAGPWPGK